MQHSTRPAHSDQKPANDATGAVRDGVLMVGGVAALAACCLGGTLLLAVGGGVIASVVYGPWGLGATLVGIAAWGVWRYHRQLACRVETESVRREHSRG